MCYHVGTYRELEAQGCYAEWFQVREGVVVHREGVLPGPGGCGGPVRDVCMFLTGAYRELEAQGCYAEWFQDRDLPNRVEMTAVTPQKCMTACRDRGYLFAGTIVSACVGVCACGWVGGWVDWRVVCVEKLWEGLSERVCVFLEGFTSASVLWCQRELVWWVGVRVLEVLRVCLCACELQVCVLQASFECVFLKSRFSQWTY